jgi:hypothetical protein
MLVVSRHGLHHMKTQVIYSRDEEAYALIRKEGKSGTHKPRSKTVLKVEIVYENLSFYCYCYRVQNSRCFSQGKVIHSFGSKK